MVMAMPAAEVRSGWMRNDICCHGMVDRWKVTAAVSDTMEFNPLCRSGFPYNGRKSDSHCRGEQALRIMRHGGIYGAASR